MRSLFLITMSLMALLPVTAYASAWYLVMVEGSQLYDAVAAHRVEVTLLQTKNDTVSIWVRTDYLRPEGYEYPKKPRASPGHISTSSFLWVKERFEVNCKSQKMSVTEGSYMLANENIEWSRAADREVRVTPDTIFELIFKIVCVDEQERSKNDIEHLLALLENTILHNPQERQRMRDEKNIPDIDI